MFQRIKETYRRPYLFSRLMQIYSALLIGIITLGVILLSIYTAYTNRKNLENQVGVIENHLRTFIDNKNNSVSFMYTELAGSYGAVDNLRQYIELSPSEYFSYTDKFWKQTHVDSSVPAILTGFFKAFPDLEEISVKLDESDTYIKATRDNRNGVKLSGIYERSQGLTIQKFIVRQTDLQSMGKINVVFSKEATLANLSSSIRDLGISAFIYDQSGNILFSDVNNLKRSDEEIVTESIKSSKDMPKKLEKKYSVEEKRINQDLSYIILANKKTLLLKDIKVISIIIIFGVILASILLLVLKRTFNRYLTQVSTLVKTTKLVGEGDFKKHVDTREMQEEMYDLACAINYMVDNINDFIKENYELEIKQRDAHMRALQAQINPHFLYNTLEYIRMYAISLQQEELADVVFAFSALLRNNTNQEKTTTLEKELSFCEKYVYLYQMRYPDQIAYQFEIDDSLKDIVIPKFSIQPLIENYFVHGIDYSRFDNAIKVMAKKVDEKITIEVRDNGKGITTLRLNEILENLKDADSSLPNSIGLKNVHERLKSFFTEGYQFNIESPQEGGTIFTIEIQKCKGEKIV